MKLLTLLFLSFSAFGSSDPIFSICEKKESNCISTKVEASIIEYANSISPECKEISYRVKDGKGGESSVVAYYECRVLVKSKNDTSAINIRVKPSMVFTKYSFHRAE
jgi:hypothetical protein